MPFGNMTIVYPSSRRPGIIFPRVNDVPFNKYFAEISARGDESDLALYQPIVPYFTTPTSIGQQWRGSVDQVDFSLDQLVYYYYTIQAAYSYTDEEEKRFARMVDGISLPDFLDRLSRMGINQRTHRGSLFGFDPSEDQGLINLGATESLPADSDSNTTITSYLIAELFEYVVSKARDVMSESYGTLRPVIVASSPRIINYMRTAIIPITSYAQGGGTDSIATAYDNVAGNWLGVGKTIFISDLLLQGTGTDGDDQILFIAPGISEQDAVDPKFSQYLLDDIPSNANNTFMDAPGGLLKTANTPLHRTNSFDLSYKTTAGALIRQAAIQIVEAPYE